MALATERECRQIATVELNFSTTVFVSGVVLKISAQITSFEELNLKTDKASVQKPF